MILKELIRQDSLSKLGLDKRPEILVFLDSKLLNLERFKDDKHPNFIFWCKSKEDIYIQQDLKNGYFYINSDKVWSVLESEFTLNYSDIQSLTTWYVETTYNLKGIHNSFRWGIFFEYVETTYNLKGIHNLISLVVVYN